MKNYYFITLILALFYSIASTYGFVPDNVGRYYMYESGTSMLIINMLVLVIISAIISGLIVVFKKILGIHKKNWPLILMHSTLFITVTGLLGKYRDKINIENKVYSLSDGMYGNPGELESFSLFYVILTIITIVCIYLTRTRLPKDSIWIGKMNSYRIRLFVLIILVIILLVGIGWVMWSAMSATIE